MKTNLHPETLDTDGAETPSEDCFLQFTDQLVARVLERYGLKVQEPKAKARYISVVLKAA
jgi:hypothetical protein